MKFRSFQFLSTVVVLSLLSISTNLFSQSRLGFGLSKQPNKGVPNSELQPSTPEAPTPDVVPEEDIRKSLQNALKTFQYGDALKLVSSLPSESIQKNDMVLKDRLDVIVAVDQSEDNSAKIIQGDDDLDAEDQETIKRLYRESQKSFIAGDDDLTKDLLIQIVFINRRHYKAKQFLKLGFGLDTGAYVVEDKQTRFWEQSSVFFYGGNYERAVNVLKMLAVFDPKNSKIHERMGSAYYMLSQKKEAIESWTTALFLDPKNKTLEHFIAETEKSLAADREQAKQAREEKQNRKKSGGSDGNSGIEMQLLGVFPTQAKAYSYAQKLKDENQNPVVEQLDNGKWSVSVPKAKK
jgi:tetratricopeptide (TPR) repeat protein